MPHALSRRLICTAAAVALSPETGPFGGAQAGSDPFEFLAPWVVVSEGDRARLDRDQVLSRVLSGKGGQLAVFVATRLNAPPDALVAWTRAIAELNRSKFVLAIARFSDPPCPSDLEDLTLDQSDLDAIRQCRPGNCGLKLSAGDMESLTGAVATARGVLGDRVERQAPVIVRGLRARLESGNPPDAISDPFAKGRPGVR